MLMEVPWKKLVLAILDAILLAIVVLETKL